MLPREPEALNHIMNNIKGLPLRVIHRNGEIYIMLAKNKKHEIYAGLVQKKLPDHYPSIDKYSFFYDSQTKEVTRFGEVVMVIDKPMYSYPQIAKAIADQIYQQDTVY